MFEELSYYQKNKDRLLEYQKEYNNSIPKYKIKNYNNQYYNNVRRYKKYKEHKPPEQFITIKTDNNTVEF